MGEMHALIQVAILVCIRKKSPDNTQALPTSAECPLMSRTVVGHKVDPAAQPS